MAIIRKNDMHFLYHYIYTNENKEIIFIGMCMWIMIIKYLLNMTIINWIPEISPYHK